MDKLKLLNELRSCLLCVTIGYLEYVDSYGLNYRHKFSTKTHISVDYVYGAVLDLTLLHDGEKVEDLIHNSTNLQQLSLGLKHLYPFSRYSTEIYLDSIVSVVKNALQEEEVNSDLNNLIQMSMEFGLINSNCEPLYRICMKEGECEVSQAQQIYKGLGVLSNRHY